MFSHACAQEGFMRLLLARKPDPFFDTVSVVFVPGQQRDAGSHRAAAVPRGGGRVPWARGGMVSSKSNIWKGALAAVGAPAHSLNAEI